MIWASIGVYSEKNSDETVADSTKSLVKAILGVAWWVLLSLDLETLVIGQVNFQTITKQTCHELIQDCQILLSLMNFPQHPARRQDRHCGG